MYPPKNHALGRALQCILGPFPPVAWSPLRWGELEAGLWGHREWCNDRALRATTGVHGTPKKTLFYPPLGDGYPVFSTFCVASMLLETMYF